MRQILIDDKKIDKRVRYYLLIDTETANSLENPLVYDVGFVVTDRQGRIYEKHSYLVEEIMVGEKELMKTAYYAEKIPMYREKYRKGEISLKKFNQIRWIIHQTMKKYNIDTVMAYNMPFDYKALHTTQRWLTSSKYRWFFPYGTEFHCIWRMMRQTIGKQKMFEYFIDLHDLRTPTGRASTSAETTIKYMRLEPDFAEEHTGLEDAIIETEIFARIMRQHKKMERRAFNKKEPYKDKEHAQKIREWQTLAG